MTIDPTPTPTVPEPFLTIQFTHRNDDGVPSFHVADRHYDPVMTTIDVAAVAVLARSMGYGLWSYDHAAWIVPVTPSTID